MLAVGWSWDARVMGVVACIPLNILSLSTSVAVHGAVIFHLILFKIGGSLRVRFASATRPW